jgi:hypothetical protein
VLPLAVCVWESVRSLAVCVWVQRLTQSVCVWVQRLTQSVCVWEQQLSLTDAVKLVGFWVGYAVWFQQEYFHSSLIVFACG